MKNDKYHQLLRDVINRLLYKTDWGSLNSSIQKELENAKETLLSSGYDLDDVIDFNAEVSSAVSEYFMHVYGT